MKNKQQNSLKQTCGLCGKSNKKLIKTECCNNWICDDADTYVAFSYQRNSCYRNHDRYTLCSYHHHEEHIGKWQYCQKCKDSFDTPNYTDFGTNKYNFEVLGNPEKYTIVCVYCNCTVNSLEKISYQTSKGYYCTKRKCQEAAYKL
jgi:hypothetical protein